MAYTKVHDTWENGESGATPIDAAALVHMEQGIADAAATADAAQAGLASKADSSALVSKVDTTDARLSNARPPTTHHMTHAIGGSDPLTPANIGAIPETEKGAANGVASLDATTKVPVAQIPALPESQITGLTADLAATEKTANKGAANGYAGLDSSGKVPLAELPALPESQITNLTTDLAATEKTANKGAANGYAGLDSGGKVPLAELPALPESQITGLTADLAATEKTANKGVAGGYASLDGSTKVPVAQIPSLPESQITNLTTDLAATEKTANKGVAGGYASLDGSTKVPVAQIPSLPESQITNLTTDLAATEKTANKGVANGYAPLDSSGKVPSANLPAGGGGGGGGLQKRIELCPFTYYSMTGFVNVSQQATWGLQIYTNGVNTTDEMRWAGIYLDSTQSYKLTMVAVKGNDQGIHNYEISPDGITWTSVGTFDAYSASITRQVSTVVASFTVASSGTYFFRVRASGKNASSIGYYVVLFAGGPITIQPA